MGRPRVRVADILATESDYPGFVIVNTTSRATTYWERTLSPFFLGPVEVYGGRVAKVFENLWQFSKVYAQHADPDTREPLRAYWKWAEAGWADNRAHRYPMGRGAKPLYSLWDGKRLEYVEARQKIYAPLYGRAVQETGGFQKLQEMRAEGTRIVLQDFDGYDHIKEKLSLRDVFRNPERKMGHAFIIYALLTNDPILKEWGLA